MSLFRILAAAQMSGWNMPSDWAGHDIRTECPDNAIALKAGVASDYSSYDNLGLKAAATGGYDVYIDGVQFGGTYSSGSTCTITWSTYSATQGHSVTTPESLVAHDIIIKPAVSGNQITSLSAERVASSGLEVQGILWVHFNINYNISLWRLLYQANIKRNPKCLAITAKDDLLRTNGIGSYNEYYSASRNNNDIEHQPLFDFTSATGSLCDTCAISGKQKTITVQNLPSAVTAAAGLFFGCHAEKIVMKNCDTSGIKNWKNIFNSCINLKQLPAGLNFASMTTTDSGFQNMEGLQNQTLDFSTALNATTIRAGGTTSSHFCSGIVGIIPPQATNLTTFSITHCNITKSAMNTLFAALADYTGTGKSPVLTLTGCPCVTDWTAEEKAVAEAKGWTVGA